MNGLMDGVLTARHLELENAMAELAVLREQVATAEQLFAVREQRIISISAESKNPIQATGRPSPSALPVMR
jgi:hypothetical protein